MRNLFRDLPQDLRSGLVVFLVALPLCLGIGHASTDLENITGLPNAFVGIISGIVGGIIVGLVSGSRLGVSGPAPGLILIVLDSIVRLGSYEAFLVAVMLAGIIQMIVGFLGYGIIVNYFPSAVIKGMLAAIGLTLILKEIPHFLGYDKDFFGDEAFIQADGHNTISELLYAARSLHPGSILVGCFCLLVLIVFERPFLKKMKLFQYVPAALIAVAGAVAINELCGLYAPQLHISGKHLVDLPVVDSFKDYGSFLFFPDWSALKNPQTYGIALTIALVAGLESLLSLEATNKLDPEKNLAPANRELVAQGVGNSLTALIGGLPVTQVIVRSSANITAGARSKMSAIIHGVLLLVAILFLPQVLNRIPLSALAAILLLVGYKLTRIQLFRETFKLGYDQFIPFAGTILAIMLTDLLRGIGIGIVIGVIFILKRNYDNHYKKEHKKDEHGEHIIIVLSNEVTFLNKGSIVKTLQDVPAGARLTIDGSNCRFIDYDVLEFIHDFRQHMAQDKQIQLNLVQVPDVTISSSH